MRAVSLSTRRQVGSHAPIVRRSPVVVQFALTVPVGPIIVSVAVESWCAPKLLLGDVGSITSKACVVIELAPWDRMLVPTEAKEAAKGHHGIRDLSAHLLDHQSLDRTNVVSLRIIDVGSPQPDHSR